jgi:hypothetical protein
MPFVNSVRGNFGATGTVKGTLSLPGTFGANSAFTMPEIQWFSPGYFGVEVTNSYKAVNNALMKTVKYRRTSASSYSWWFLISSKSGNNYSPIYGAVVTAPGTGTVGDVMTFDLSTSAITFGSRKVPSSGDYYISWHSGVGGYPGLTEGGSLFGRTNDATGFNPLNGSGTISWANYAGTYPQSGSTFTTNVFDRSGGMGISVSYDKEVTSIIKDGSTPEKAGVSALAIKTLTGTTTSGWYWIKPTGYSTAKYVYCDMTNQGGGWMLMSWVYAGNLLGKNVVDIETGSDINGGITSITTTTPSVNNGGNLGQEFIDAIITNNRGACIAKYTLTGGASTLNDFYFNTDANSRFLPLANREGTTTARTQTVDTANRDNPANAWLKTCNTSYTTSGGNGAGVATGGTTVTYGGEPWGVFPFNMNNGYSGNWGFSISSYYGTAPGNPFPAWGTSSNGWTTAHNNGWGQHVSMWVKSV